tara:strand:+ start:186 stop:662 length:477 start_codon:yes stop_codon:yes gene_type:complete
MKTIIKTLIIAGALGILTACATQPSVNSVQAREQAQQDYLVQALRNSGGDIQRNGNDLLVTFPSSYLFGENSTAIRRSSGIPMLNYACKLLAYFNMSQMNVVVYTKGDHQLAAQRASILQNYLWDNHVYARFTLKSVRSINPNSKEQPRIELQIHLAE